MYMYMYMCMYQYDLFSSVLQGHSRTLCKSNCHRRRGICCTKSRKKSAGARTRPQRMRRPRRHNNRRGLGRFHSKITGFSEESP